MPPSTFILLIVSLMVSGLAHGQELEDPSLTVRAMQETDPTLLFEAFVHRHGRVYSSHEERKARFAVFRENLDKVRAMNNKRESSTDAVFGVTGPFSDMTELEFRTKVLMGRLSEEGKPKPTHVVENPVGAGSVPDAWEWNDHGAVTRVKQQGSVGSCWAFSATGNVEGQNFLAGNDLVDLSVEQIVDCDGTMFQNDTGDCGPNGGYPSYAFDYLIRQGGIMSDKDYPYCIGDFACSPCAPDGYNKTICGPPPGGWAHPCYAKDSCKAKLDPAKFVTKVVGWAQLAPGLNETEMASQLYNHGPISIAIDARTLQFYIFGIVSPLFCSSDPNKADHAVLVTGYGTEEDMLLQETPFWNVKNSWGELWGHWGFFKLRRGTNTCGVANHATTSVVE